MKKGDEVVFNNATPKYLVEELGTAPNRIAYIDKDNWVFLKRDHGNPKKMIHQKWLKVVREA